MSIKDEIKVRSIRESVGKEYIKPDPNKVASQILALQSNEDAWVYLTEARGLNKETIEYFQLGYDYERNAISIPIKKDNEVVSIKYRNLSQEGPKYGTESGCESWFFHENGLAGEDVVIVTEGEFDAMSVWQSGHKNVISPAQGKNSYTVWVEKLDAVPKVILAYDNDAAGQEEAIRFADKVGVEKTYELKYPQGIKDANEFLLNGGDFSDLVSSAVPFYTYQYQGLAEVVKSLRREKKDYIKLDSVPEVRIEEDWMVVISGITNIGKTTYVLNVTKELAEKNVPVLVFPFERGVRAVGQRYLQLEFEKGKEQIENLTDEEWDKGLEKVKNKPIFFSKPKPKEVEDTILKAHRLFGIKAVVIDHMDYLIRGGSGNREQDIANTLQYYKQIAEDKGIMLFIVTHIRKQETKGSIKPKAPVLEDLKGSASLYQDPEVVVMLYKESNSDDMVVDILKNKGDMTKKSYSVNMDTGVMKDADDF